MVPSKRLVFKPAARLLPAVAAAVLLIAVADGAHAALLSNGSFEGNLGTAGYGAGSVGITGWTVAGSPTNPTADIQWNTNHDTSGITTPYGDGYLDLTGTRDTAPYASILQGFATTIGQSYAVTFYLGYDNDNVNYRGPASALVSITGAASQTFTTTAAGLGAQWQAFEYDFVATSNATVLSFQGIRTGGPFFIGLDNVAVNALAAPGAVPEPAPLALLGLGSVAALALRRRRVG